MIRHVIYHNFDGLRLVGTYHEPQSGVDGGAQPVASSGVLLLNAGPAPRAGNSDMSVAICDRLAESGYPAFRFDLPGLGDSEGPSPTDIPTYWNDVLHGRNDAAATSLVDHVVQTYGLRSLAVGGLCAGAVTAIRLAASRSPILRGLILLEPNFRVELGVVLPRNVPTARPVSPDGPLSKVRRKVHEVCARVGLAPYPPETDASLFRGLHSSIEHGVDTIAVLAAGLQSTRHMAIVARQLSREAKPRLTLVSIGQTNHILTSGDAKTATCDAVAKWMVGAHASSSRKVAGNAYRRIG